MTEKKKNIQTEIKSIGSELLLPVAALCFTIYYFSTIVDVPWTAQVSALIVGSILILLVILFIIKSVRALYTGSGAFNFDTLLEPRSFVGKRIALLGLTISYIFAVSTLGFTITTFFFLSLAMLLLGGRQKWRIIFFLSTILTLGGYLLFIVAFKTRFPSGPFEKLMEGLF
ncbi:MAG: tripartite tricarboxylate transporter TctB family protein [Deltaproteobacteria bacterium]|nr:tripartite tricarboxylate transporter TctB family protein [Deltaproteobacteria bacterium]